MPVPVVPVLSTLRSDLRPATTVSTAIKLVTTVTTAIKSTTAVTADCSLVPAELMTTTNVTTIEVTKMKIETTTESFIQTTDQETTMTITPFVAATFCSNTVDEVEN